VHVVALVPPGSTPIKRIGVETTPVYSPFWHSSGRNHRGGIPALIRTKPQTIAKIPQALRRLHRATVDVADSVDLFHAHWIPTRLSAYGIDKPIVTTAHGADVRMLEKLPLAAAHFVGRGPVIVATAELEKRVQALAPSTTTLRIYPVGVEPRVAPSSKPEDFRGLAIMRLAPEKGVHELAEAWIKVRRALPQATLAIVGDGPFHHQLELPGVEFIGNIHPNRIPEEIRRASLYVQSSRDESFGVATVEALVHGCPVVATATGIAAEVVDERYGRVVPIGDPYALSVALIELLNDPEKLLTMGQRASADFSHHFRWETVIDRLLLAYESTLQYPHHSRQGRQGG